MLVWCSLTSPLCVELAEVADNLNLSKVIRLNLKYNKNKFKGGIYIHYFIIYKYIKHKIFLTGLTPHIGVVRRKFSCNIPESPKITANFIQ